MEKLKNCPFCGSDAVELRKGMLFNGAVHCNNCSADVVFDAVRLIDEDGVYEETPWKEAVTRGWNRRPHAQTAQKTGKWEVYVISPFDGEDVRCSECGQCGCVPYWDYCPNCGAKMEVE